MFKVEIKEAKNGYKYLRVQKDNYTFCIFETQDFLISHISIECTDYIWGKSHGVLRSYHGTDLEELYKICTLDTYPIFLKAFKERWKLKELDDLYNEIDCPFAASMQHEKP